VKKMWIEPAVEDLSLKQTETWGWILGIFGRNNYWNNKKGNNCDLDYDPCRTDS